MSTPAPEPPRPRVVHRPDDLDLRLLTLLQQDPRSSLRALARSAGVAPGTVSERLDRLRVLGVIRGVVLDIDPAALGYSLEVLLGVAVSPGTPLAGPVETLLGLPWVREVHAVTGRWDLVVILCVRDQDHLLDVIQNQVWPVPGLVKTESLVILKSHVKTGAVLDQLDAEG
jgi:DNA-binding Lrp family transcriptional regulator